MIFTEDDIYLIFLDTRPQIQRFVSRRIRCQDTTAYLLQDLYLRLRLLTPPMTETPQQFRERLGKEAVAWASALVFRRSIRRYPRRILPLAATKHSA